MIDPSQFQPDRTNIPQHPGVQAAPQDGPYEDATESLEHLKVVLDSLSFDSMFPPVERRRGRPPEDRASLARSLVAKATLGIATTSELVERLHADEGLRRVCGWRWRSEVPSQSTFSRAQAEFVARSLPVPVGPRAYARIATMPDPAPSEPEFARYESCDGDPLLLQLHTTIRALVQRNQPDLTLQQLAVFLACHTSGQHMTVAALRQEVGVSSATIIRCINRLCVLGLVTRKSIPWNRRSVTIEPTEDGRTLMHRLLTPVQLQGSSWRCA